MNAELHRELEERLIRYVRIDTQSDEASSTSPSTAKQFDLLNLLKAELEAIGAQDIVLTEYGALLATIPATMPSRLPTCRPLRCWPMWTRRRPTAEPASSPLSIAATPAKPSCCRTRPTRCCRHRHRPTWPAKIGDDIVTASGTTLLGADDKAGLAIVMAAARHLLQHSDIAHGPIRIGFTPDEEIGRGVHAKLPEDLNADFAYTLDGAEKGEIVYETFSADKATVTVTGVSIHPGQAKDKLVNALHLAAKIIDTLPQVTLTPETTDGRQGFIHIYQMSGTAARAELHFILRDFERDGLAAQGVLIQQVCATIQATEPRAEITCEITPQYRNMRYWLEADMRPVELAREACRQVGIEPFSVPVRGGTDGSRLTELGVPTPNVFTGMQNIHGPLEWVSVQDMAAATQMCIKLAELWGKETNGDPEL